MPSVDNSLPRVPQRVLIAGVSGSGKTTMARRLETGLRLPRYELDALHHGPGWEPRLTFLDDVRDFAGTERWISEWQYRSKGIDEVLPPRADTVVWLDYPDRIVRARLWRRTLGRSILRRELWNGNREPTLWQLATTTDPNENVLRWQTKTLQGWRTSMPDYADRFPHLQIVRLTHPRQAGRLLRALHEHATAN